MLGLGLVGRLLAAPVSLPAAGMKFIFEQVADLADAELNDESVVHQQLLLLQVQLEEGDIEEEEYVEREAELMLRLREIKARKRAMAELSVQDAGLDREPGSPEVPIEANVAARRRVFVETPFDE